MVRQNIQQSTVEENWRRTSAAAAEEEKWNWLGHTLRRSDDSIVKYVLQWT